MICESFDGYEDSDSCLSLQSAIGWLEFSGQPSPTNLYFTIRLCDLIGVKCPIRASVLTK